MHQNNTKKNKPNPSTINTKPLINDTNSLSIYNTITTIRLKPLDNYTKPNIAINIAMLWSINLFIENPSYRASGCWVWSAFRGIGLQFTPSTSSRSIIIIFFWMGLRSTNTFMLYCNRYLF